MNPLPQTNVNIIAKMWKNFKNSIFEIMNVNCMKVTFNCAYLSNLTVHFVHHAPQYFIKFDNESSVLAVSGFETVFGDNLCKHFGI